MPTSSPIWRRSRRSSTIWCAPCRQWPDLSNAAEASLERVLARGCWTPVERFNDPQGWHDDGDDADGSLQLWTTSN
jgi:hypothetical protein